MFCSSCGAKLPDLARFCFNCGAQSGVFDFAQAGSTVPQTRIVPAKCTGCGASLNVDPNQETAVCPYCRSTYNVEKAIKEFNISVNGNLMVNGATININGKNAGNLLKRGEDYARKGNFPKALDYFNEALDIDPSLHSATQGIQKIQDVLNNYVYCSENTQKGRLELKKERLILVNDAGPTLFELVRIFELTVSSKGFFSSGKCLQFTYNGLPKKRVTFDTEKPDKWFVLLEDAKMGKYPQMVNLGELYRVK